MTDFNANDLPDLVEWRSAFDPPPDGTAFLASHLSISSALLFAELMNPTFILVEDCVVLATRYSPENFAEWRMASGGSSSSIERALNHFHLWDMFEPMLELEEQAVERLAQLVASSWLSAAQRQFPERQFEVEVSDEYGPTVTITSRTKRNA